MTLSASAGRTGLHQRVNEAGMTLIEVLVAMSIFLIVAAGVAGSMIVGLRATAHSRQATQGEAVAQAQFEEMKARPYYVPYSSNPAVGTTAAVDLLARYYPGLNTSRTTDSQGWTGWYTGANGDAYYTIASPVNSQGIALTVVTRFVDNTGSIVTPPASYNSTVAGADVPPSNLVKVTITATSAQNPSNNYVFDSMISATTSESCAHSSNSHVDIFGAVLKVSTGASEPYMDYLDASLGEAHATTGFGCTPSPQASAIGGKLSLFAGPTASGASVAISGPPDAQQLAGPLDVTTSSWPIPSFLASQAQAHVESDGSHEVEADGQTTVGTQSLRLQQVDGSYDDGGDGMRWDFVNPTVTATSGTVSNNDQIKAELEQDDGRTSGQGQVSYQQVNILPLQAVSANTPSARQGLVFVRTFSASASSDADGKPGDINNSVTYSATVGVFNPDKPADCTGDDCYDIYTSVGPQNPLQTAVDLSQAKYGLQSTLLSEWYSSSASDLASAMAASSDGTTSSINVDALMKLSGAFGSEVRLGSDGAVTLVNPQGYQQVWLGSVDISILQNK
ncbi:MAG: type II secretion system protein [Actinomycetota bacterium]|nr:type II secretion system GspH family protein [Actinomycetota bacterium]MDA8167015.1 type II secretion system protein [Actinomycetota bacterium]